MLRWSVIFLVIALLVAALGFGGMATGSDAFFARILFFVFMVLFVMSVIERRKSSRV